MTELSEVTSCSQCNQPRAITIIVRGKTDEFYCSDDCFQASRLGFLNRND